MTEKKISFSELKLWNDCPHKHKLVYKDQIPHFKGNEYTAFGTAVHSVCERIILDNKLDPGAIFKSSFQEEINNLVKDEVIINDDFIKEMKEQVQVLLPLILPAVKAEFGEYEVFSVEEKLMQEIDEFESHGRKFKGFIDLVIKTPDNKYHIIDWKTCSWGWNSRKKTDPMTTYQLTYYKNYFSKKHNIELKNIETYFILLKRTAKKENIEICRVSSGVKKIENSLKLLEKAVINIERENFIKNRLSCKYCVFYKTTHCP